ncbi:MAG: hypothetical protein FWD31_05755 [Planctomycetaceae bacterium]|nr:hypothetical protein [Planctomycetaceae bacterium]
MTNPELIINQELRDLLPPLSPEVFAGLEADILQDGCTDPLIVWGEILVDGHHRYKICKNNKIPFKTQQKDFASLIDAKIWMCDRQENRRNLTLYQRGVIALKMKSVFAEHAKQNQKQSLGRGKKGLPNLANLNTRYKLSEKFNIASGTLQMVALIEAHASEEVKQNLCADKTSINKEYKRLKAEIDSKQPAKPKKNKSSTNAKTTSTKAATTEQTNVSTQSTFFETTPSEESEPTVTQPPKIVTVSLKSGPKVKDTYCCGVEFDPDPDDDYYDWITREEREELRERQKTCPNKLVPQIRSYTIQSIPEHDPQFLISCMYSLFQPLYRKKFLGAFVEKMFAKGEEEAAREVFVTLKEKFQL